MLPAQTHTSQAGRLAGFRLHVLAPRAGAGAPLGLVCVAWGRRVTTAVTQRPAPPSSVSDPLVDEPGPAASMRLWQGLCLLRALTRMHGHVCARNARTHAHTLMHTCIHMRMHAQTRVHSHVHVHMCTRMHAHALTHALLTHAQCTHVRAHTQSRTDVSIQESPHLCQSVSKYPVHSVVGWLYFCTWGEAGGWSCSVALWADLPPARLRATAKTQSRGRHVSERHKRGGRRRGQGQR